MNYRTPWGGTAPPPAMRLLNQQEARLAAPAAGVVLALPEVVGIAPLGRIIYALASGRTLEEVEREYFQRLYQGSVWQVAGHDVDRMRQDVERGSLLATIALMPGIAGAGRHALKQAAKHFVAGGAVTAGVTTPIAAMQGRSLTEIQQIALESFLAGGTLADVAVLGRQGLRALADRLKTVPSADIVNKLRQLRLPDTEISEFVLRRNMELEAFRREIETLPMDELLRLRNKYREMLDAYINNDISKIRNIREPRWEIEDKLDVLNDVINQRRNFPHDIDLAHAATVLNPPPRITPRIDANVRSLLQRIARKSPDALARIEQEIADMPDDVRQFLEAAVQKRLMALRGAKWEERIKSAKTVDELARIEQEMPHDVLQRYQELIQKRLMELKTGIPRGDEGPRVRFEPRKEPPQPGGGGRAESPRRGGQVLELLTKEEQKLLTREEPRATPKARALRSAPKAETKLDEQSVKTKSEDGTRVKTEAEAKQVKDGTNEEFSARTEAEAKTEQGSTVKTTTDTATDTAAVRVDAVPAGAVLYTVTPTAAIYRAGDAFYAVLKNGDILMYSPTKLPPRGGGWDGGGGGWVPWGREGRARRLRGEKMKVY